jgi:hypothetical protein
VRRILQQRQRAKGEELRAKGKEAKGKRQRASRKTKCKLVREEFNRNVSLSPSPFALSHLLFPHRSLLFALSNLPDTITSAFMIDIVWRL